MPFLEHLQELRRCLRNAILALLGGIFIAFWFAEPLLVILARPLVVAWQHAGLESAVLNYGSLTEPFWVYVELALYAGIFIASPFIFHQLWRFVAPGLYKHERHIALPFALISGLFFLGGAVFCYFVVFPPAFRFFLSYSSDNLSHIRTAFGFVATDLADPLAVRPVLMMREYLSLATKMLLGFGLVFELPLLIFFLSWAGVITHRSLWRFNKYAVVIAFVIGAVLTPGPDVVSQVLMAGPMVVLYNLSIIVAFVVTRRREARQASGGRADGSQGTAGH